MPRMRLDKLLSHLNCGSRKEVQAMIRTGRVTVDGAAETDPAAKVDPDTACVALDGQVQRYRARISGPLLDRIDIHIEMPEVGYRELSDRSRGEPSSAIRARVNAARARQRERFAGEGILCNAQMNANQVRAWCTPEGAAERLLQQAFTRLRLSARAYQRILKVARTIADLAGSERIMEQHYAEAIQYRSLDMNVR